MTISGQKLLIPCPVGERAATVERTVLTRSSRKRPQPLRNCLRRNYCFSQRTITDGSPPRNAPLRLPQSTNDSGACTPRTSISRANYFLQQAIHKSGELPKCKIAIIGTPRVHFGKFVRNWNNTDNDLRMTETGPSLPPLEQTTKWGLNQE